MSQKKRDKNKTDQSFASEDKIKKNENGKTGDKARQAPDGRDDVAATSKGESGAGSAKDKKTERKPEAAAGATAAHAVKTHDSPKGAAKPSGNERSKAGSPAAPAAQNKGQDKPARPENQSQTKSQPQAASTPSPKSTASTASTSSSSVKHADSQSASQRGKNENVTKQADPSSDKKNAAAPNKTASAKQTTAPGNTTATKSAPARPAASAGGASRAAGSNGPRPPVTGKTADGGGGHQQGGGKNAGLMATVALILAIVALIVSGYLWYQSQQQVATLNAQIDTVKSDVQDQVNKQIAPELSDMSDRVRDAEGKLDDLGKTNDTQKQKIATLQQHVQRVTGKYHQLSDQLGGNHQRFVEQRIALLLEAANQRLQVNHDPQSAMRALVLADQSIQRVGDPALSPVRKEIASEYYQLKALPNPDIQGLSLKLDKLIQQVPKLPLVNGVPSSYESKGNGSNDETDGAASDQDTDQDTASGTSELAKKWHALVGSVTSVVSNAVTIQHTNGDKSKPALLPPQKAYYLTQNLQLELRTARLALLEGKPKVYQNAVTQAIDWIKQYFDTDDKQVKVVLEQLGQLSQAKLDWTAPNISGSLDALHQVMNQRGKTDSQNNKPAESSDTNPSDQDQQDNRQAPETAPKKSSGDDSADHGEDS